MKNPEQFQPEKLPNPEAKKELCQSASTIIEKMKNYEPLSYPENEDDTGTIGSNVPNSFFIHEDRMILVETCYDPKSRGLLITAVDQLGDELRDVIKEYDVWSWHVSGRKNIEKEVDEITQRGTHCVSGGTPDEKTLCVFREEDVPPGSAQKYKVEKTRQQQKTTTLNLSAKIDPDGVPEKSGWTANNLGEDKLNLPDDKFHDILKQVAENMVPFVENPELHITLEQLEDRLKPDRYSQAGFMAEDEKLFSIIDRDTKMLEKHKVTFDDVASRIAYLFDTSEKNGQEIVIGDSHFKVEWLQTRGFQLCPWGILDNWHLHQTGSPNAKRYEQFGYLGKKYKRFGSRDYKITNLKTGEAVSLPQMAPHLIGDHHFFEGNTDYRMDPEKLIEVLEISQQK